MKITFLINRDLPALLAVNYLLPKLCEHSVSVFYSDKAAINDLPADLQQLARFEQKVLSDMENTGHHKSLLSLQQLRQYTCADIIKLNSVNTSDFKKLQQSQADLIISVRHMTILKDAVIKLPKLGVINLHSGLLPSYQGVMSTFRAMQNKESVVGSTLHFIEDKNIDSGAIIARMQTAMYSDKSYLWNVLSLYSGGCQSIQDAINCLASDKPLTSMSQQGAAHYYSYPKQAELAEFEQQGFRLFDANDLNDFQINAE